MKAALACPMLGGERRPVIGCVGAIASAPHAKANAQLPADALNRVILGDPEVVKRVHWMAPVSEEQRHKNQEIWDEVKTGFAQ